MSEPAKQAVILVHGLYMKPWTWMSYRRFLSRQGYQVYLFGYKTTSQSFDLTLMQLTAFVNSRPEKTVHLVAHSMGGILSVRALAKIRKAGKLVMLGTPLNGSKVARKLLQRGWHKGLLKYATEPLTTGAVEAVKHRETLMIAGTSPFGLGRFIEPRLGPSDGTVAVAETKMEWLDQHCEINCSHFGLLRNKQAKELTLAFLKQ
jgi:pimeloyl-ACP methyl ester carboxylesterase